MATLSIREATLFLFLPPCNGQRDIKQQLCYHHQRRRRFLFSLDVDEMLPSSFSPYSSEVLVWPSWALAPIQIENRRQGTMRMHVMQLTYQIRTQCSFIKEGPAELNQSQFVPVSLVSLGRCQDRGRDRFSSATNWRFRRVTEIHHDRKEKRLWLMTGWLVSR